MAAPRDVAIGFAGNPRVENRADAFGTELLVPLSELTRHVRHWPTQSSTDPGKHEAYLDHVDRIAAVFNVPQSIISERIRRLECLRKMHGELVLT